MEIVNSVTMRTFESILETPKEDSKFLFQQVDIQIPSNSQNLNAVFELTTGGGPFFETVQSLTNLYN